MFDTITQDLDSISFLLGAATGLWVSILFLFWLVIKLANKFRREISQQRSMYWSIISGKQPRPPDNPRDEANWWKDVK